MNDMPPEDKVFLQRLWAQAAHRQDIVHLVMFAALTVAAALLRAPWALIAGVAALATLSKSAMVDKDTVRALMTGDVKGALAGEKFLKKMQALVGLHALVCLGSLLAVL